MQICVDSLSRKYSEAEHRGEHVLLQGYLRIIDDELKRCAAITAGLLDFSRERPPKKEPVDVKDARRGYGKRASYPEEVFQFLRGGL